MRLNGRCFSRIAGNLLRNLLLIERVESSFTNACLLDQCAFGNHIDDSDVTHVTYFAANFDVAGTLDLALFQHDVFKQGATSPAS